MIALINGQSRQFTETEHRIEVTGAGGGDWAVLLSDYVVSIWGVGRVLRVSSGDDGSPALCLIVTNATELYTCKYLKGQIIYFTRALKIIMQYTENY